MKNGAKTCSEKFGLLLAHFFSGGRKALSLSGASRLSGLSSPQARALLQLLAREGLVRRAGAGGPFLADKGSASYRCCLKAYRGRRAADGSVNEPGDRGKNAERLE